MRHVAGYVTGGGQRSAYWVSIGCLVEFRGTAIKHKDLLRALDGIKDQSDQKKRRERERDKMKRFPSKCTRFACVHMRPRAVDPAQPCSLLNLSLSSTGCHMHKGLFACVPVCVCACFETTPVMQKYGYWSSCMRCHSSVHKSQANAIADLRVAVLPHIQSVANPLSHPL